MYRRQVLGGVTAVAVAAVAGCVAAEAEITDTQVAHGGDGRVGVMVSLRDTSPKSDAPVTVRGRLLDGGTVVDKGTKTVDLPPSNRPSNVVIWFEGVESGRKYSADAKIVD